MLIVKQIPANIDTQHVVADGIHCHKSIGRNQCCPLYWQTPGKGVNWYQLYMSGLNLQVIEPWSSTLKADILPLRY